MNSCIITYLPKHYDSLLGIHPEALSLYGQLLTLDQEMDKLFFNQIITKG